MPTAEPLDAASVIVVREGTPFEVLLVARSVASRRMGGFWVFPGGIVEPADGDGAGRFATAALRELAEEAGIRGVARSDLQPFARWISPASLAARFDTIFFLAHVASGIEPLIDGVECTAARWFTPRDALCRAREGEVPLLFPTRTQLERLGSFASMKELFAFASGTTLSAITPRFRFPGDQLDPLLPGDDGYVHATG